LIYDVTTLSVSVGKTPQALDLIGKAVRDATASTLHACWYCEIGAVGDILLIRGYPTAEAVQADRERMVMDGDPFNLGDILESITRQSFVQFPFLAGIASGKLGPFYEVRVYQTTRPGIAATIALWRDAVPHRVKISPLVTAMYAIDGAIPRFMHIWPFPSLDARQALRQKAFDSGFWPPGGGLVHLRRFSSSIYLPAAFSPLD
jgi:hypothetical protein